MLTAKRKAFITEYLKDFNGTQAAIRAGYSERTANEQAARLLANSAIKNAIQEHQAKAAEKAGVSLEWWLKRMRQLAEFDPRKYFDEQGNLLPIAKLDDEAAAALSGIEVVELERQPGSVKKVKFTDRRAALDLIGKHLGVYSADNKMDITVDNLTDGQVDKLYGQLIKKLKQ